VDGPCRALCRQAKQINAPDSVTSNQLWTMGMAVERGELSQGDFEQAEHVACPTCGFLSNACLDQKSIEFHLDSGFESLAQHVVIWARSSQGFESGDDDVISDEFWRQEAQEEQAIGQGVEHSNELLHWHR